MGSLKFHGSLTDCNTQKCNFALLFILKNYFHYERSVAVADFCACCQLLYVHNLNVVFLTQIWILKPSPGNCVFLNPVTSYSDLWSKRWINYQFRIHLGLRF